MTARTTPMLEQYWQVKSEHPDKLVFFRLGDFYELFYEDAEIASRELELTLTARENKHERIPMCGVPYQAAEAYLSRLVERGYKVVLCDQVEDPRQSKGLVRREVVRVVTPGTLIESSLLGDRRSNYLTAVFRQAGTWAVASVDLLSGECLVTETAGDDALQQVVSELHRLTPAECLLPAADDRKGEDGVAWSTLVAEVGHLASVTTLPAAAFAQDRARAQILEQYGPSVLHGIDQGSSAPAQCALGALLSYLVETQRRSIRHLSPPRFYRVGDYLLLDASARRHLELTQRWSDGGKSKRDTLFGVLDHTQTAMGARRLQSWIEQPLVDQHQIERRLDAVENLVHDHVTREELRRALRHVYDLERLSGRIALGTANARELVALRRSLSVIPSIKAALEELASELLQDVNRRLDPLGDVRELLDRALVDEPPVAITEGGLFRDGYHGEVDRLRNAARHGKRWLADLERAERERTGIKSLKVGYNKVFGYYLEVTHANRHLVPEDYERKQTLANAERYVTPELKEMEARILGAEERLMSLEYQLFTELRARVADQVARLQQTASALADLDALMSLAEAAVRFGYVRPSIHQDLRLRIRDGRHPVLERQPGVRFVPNDTDLDGTATHMAIVTGPNMGGKSTYLRQVALIVIMAQMGSFVPARAAEIGIVDRIFTRIGAADELSRGRSTFMVEIEEALRVLLFGTRRSLAIIDELGRGTSTFDGIAFSTAYLEYLHRHLRCRTLVSTHFFELTQLAQRLAGVTNLHAVATLEGERVVFSYRIAEGAADRSYGVEVARSAGMPPEVILRARELLASFEQTAANPVANPSAARMGMVGRISGGVSNGREAGTEVGGRVSALDPKLLTLLHALAETDILHLTPLQAFERLQAFADQARMLLAWYHQDRNSDGEAPTNDAADGRRSTDRCFGHGSEAAE